MFWRTFLPAIVAASALCACNNAANAPDQSQASTQNDWQTTIKSELPLLGHRNWIVVTDSAYPLQVSLGIQTIATSDDAITIVKQLLGMLRNDKHVRPVIFTDAELPYVPESQAPGITAYRTKLAQVLQGHGVQSELHASLISELATSGQTFRVVIVKSTETLPYTSVFIQLRAGYWTDSQEDALRRAMSKHH